MYRTKRVGQTQQYSVTKQYYIMLVGLNVSTLPESSSGPQGTDPYSEWTMHCEITTAHNIQNEITMKICTWQFLWYTIIDSVNTYKDTPVCCSTSVHFCEDWRSRWLVGKVFFDIPYIYIYIYFLISNFRRVLNIVCVLFGISPASDCDLPTFWNPLSVPSSKAGCRVLSGWWEESVVFIPWPRLARAGRTNRGGRNQVVGGQSGWVSVEGGGTRDTCQVAVGLLCVEWFARFYLSVCRRGFQALLRIRPSSRFMLFGCISISMASLMRIFIYSVSYYSSVILRAITALFWLCLLHCITISTYVNL
jgi:hypothetical protein